nr:N-acetylmuramoyl-L-alanine amidase [Pullulanibacillus pueri]
MDPGHGGIDPGTTGVDGLKEKVINLTYAKTVKNALESKGATVIMTRNKDENCQTGATGHEELQCRVDISKKYSADVYISIHANSSTSSSTTGIETHYSSKNDPEYPGVNKYPKESKLLAQAIQKEIVPALGGNSRGVISDNLYVTRKNTSPAALIEIGFMSNSSELNRIEESSVRNSFAKALTAALINYFNEIY